MGLCTKLKIVDSSKNVGKNFSFCIFNLPRALVAVLAVLSTEPIYVRTSL